MKAGGPLSPRFQPQDWMLFVELRVFTRLWEKLQLTDEDLLAVQMTILADPLGFPVIPGTGGVRKLRFSPATRAKGKRGGYRLCYVYFEQHRRVILAAVYPKNAKDDLSADEKAVIKAAVMQIEAKLGKRSR